MGGHKVFDSEFLSDLNIKTITIFRGYELHFQGKTSY